MIEHHFDLFNNPNQRQELYWFPGEILPEDGQKILEVYENDDETPSEIIISKFDAAAYADGLLQPILWWTPLPQHPIENG